MEEEEKHHVLQPLIQSAISTPATSAFCTRTTALLSCDASNILIRVSLVLLLAMISVWANFEASKGFEIAIINDVSNTMLGHWFDIFFVRNGRAIQIVLNTSQFAQTILYPPAAADQQKKLVHRVTVRLTATGQQNMSNPISVVKSNGNYEYELQFSSSVMEGPNVKKAMVSAMQRGMTRIWLWDAEGAAPKSLIDGIVEYVTTLAAGSMPPVLLQSDDHVSYCWKDKDHMAVAKFLSYCEKRRGGFIRRLNQAMQNHWDEQMVDDALGLVTVLRMDAYSSGFYHQLNCLLYVALLVFGYVCITSHAPPRPSKRLLSYAWLRGMCCGSVWASVYKACRHVLTFDQLVEEVLYFGNDSTGPIPMHMREVAVCGVETRILPVDLQYQRLCVLTLSTKL